VTHLGAEAAVPLTNAERSRLNGHAPDSDDADAGECLMPVPNDAAPPPARLMKSGNRKADQRHEYREAQGLLGYILRFEARNGERKFFLPLTYWRDPSGRGEWRRESWPKGRRPLFGLDRLAGRPRAVVALFEGEKTANALEFGPLADAFKWCGEDVIAVSWPGGGRAVQHADFSPLKGRDVIIAPDAHGTGEKTADELVRILQTVGVGRLRRWKAPPQAQRVKDGWDIADDIPPGWTDEALVKSVLGAHEIAEPRLVLTLPEFLDAFEAPDYLVDGLLQRHYFYAITAKTGAGKTAVALLISFLVANPKGKQKLGPHDVEHGRVVYVTRENPTDVRMRLIGMAAKMGFEPEDLAQTFFVIDSVDNLEKDMDRIRRDVETFGDVALVVLDTSFALFPGDDENDAKQMLEHARTQRKLCDLPGRPCVIALCHPVKNPGGPEQLLPRGGGSYLNELDGNFTLWAHDDRLTDLHWAGKLRGPDFEKITFRLPTVLSTQLMDKKGRMLPTVMAEIVTDADLAEVEQKSTFQENRLMKAMFDKPDASLAEWAQACEWAISGKAGQPNTPNKSLVQRVLGRLVKDKMATKEGRKYALTEHGKKAVSAAK
jgi:hypothetical protein